MTNREAQIFQWITENPMISQEELAAKAGIARSSAAVHISNLMKKGYILGKGYVTNGPSYCMVIGGANIDIGGISKEEIVTRESEAEQCSSGKMFWSLGGAARNICHNLRLLGVNVRFITAIGGDEYGHKMIESCDELGIDITDSLRSAGTNTSTYLYLTDEKRAVKYAVSDMGICEKLNPEFLSTKIEQLNKARMVVIDTNIPTQTIHYICKNCKAPVFAEAISVRQAHKLQSVLGQLYAITVNQQESEAIRGVTITDRHSLEKSANVILGKGTKNIFITMGSEGAYCVCEEEQFMVEGFSNSVMNHSGTRDAFMAGVALGYMKHMDVQQMAKLGVTVSSFALEDEAIINPQLCLPAVVERANIEF